MGKRLEHQRGAGYRRRDAIEDQGEFAIRGGIKIPTLTSGLMTGIGKPGPGAITMRTTLVVPS